MDTVNLWEYSDKIKRVLVVAAHPDDIDFGAAGTVATLIESGVEVAYCIVTDGDAGGSDESVPRVEMALLRREEQRNAAACLGVFNISYLGYPDGRVIASLELRRDISRVIRQSCPQLVIAPSPERVWERIFVSHPDHLAVGEATVCAIYPDARNPFAHPELLSEGIRPHVVEKLWLMADPNPNLSVDVTKHFEAKIAALECHQSQIADITAIAQRLSEAGRVAALNSGLPDGSIAELFRAISTA